MTTAAVAKRMGRHYLSIEKESEYCKYGERRLNGVTPIIGNIEKAVFDKKPLRASMKEMIAAGYFIVGETFYLKILLKEANSYQTASYYMTAKLLTFIGVPHLPKSSKASRLNGFNTWYVLRDSRLVSINDIREKYRKFKLNNG